MKYISLLLMSFLLVTNHYAQEEAVEGVEAAETPEMIAEDPVTPEETMTPEEQAAADEKAAADIAAAAEMETKKLEQWAETMQYGISDQRLATVKRIRIDKSTNALALLEESFPEDGSSTVKEEIIYTFIDMEHSGNTPFWDTLFANEKNLIVLQRAAYAVELMDIPVAASVFTALSNNMADPKAMRFNASAVQALGKLKAPEALPMITELATNITNHQDLRSASVVALGMYQDETLIPLLQGFLTNTIESRIIRRYAALAIGRTENPIAITILSPIATDEQEEQTVRLNSIAGLGYVGDEELLPILEQLTKSDNTAIRTESIKSLGRMKAVGAQDILEYKAFNDPEAIVRREAKKALQEMDVDVDALEQERKDNR